jgi:hypothetical protein
MADNTTRREFVKLYDRLLAALKKRGLHKRIVSVELINELNSPWSASGTGQPS